MSSMIRLAIVSVATMLFAAAADAPPAPAQTLVDQAVKKAKAENKAVLVHFSASW